MKAPECPRECVRRFVTVFDCQLNDPGPVGWMTLSACRQFLPGQGQSAAADVFVQRHPAQGVKHTLKVICTDIGAGSNGVNVHLFRQVFFYVVKGKPDPVADGLHGFPAFHAVGTIIS